MSKAHLASLWVLLTFGLLGWAGSGCGGGGGGGGGGPTAPPPPASGVTFTADSQPVSNSVYLAAGQGGSASIFVLDVRAQNVSDLYSASLTIEFPTNLFDYRPGGTTEGTFLSGGGQVDTELVVTNRPAGNLVIGISRLGTEPGANGSGTLLSLEFRAAASGSGSLDLRDHDALDSFGVVQEDVTWIGGSVNVRVN